MIQGLAFHGTDLYVSLNASPLSRLARFTDPDGGGVYQTRHDFVHSIPAGAHGINQLQIVGNTLYVGIGAAGRKGDPAEENVYTMTVARIVDLTQIDFSGPIGPDFTGPVNYLADPNEWINTAGGDGRLRYYASGFRNPFGIVIDADGDLWLSTNGNSDPGFLSPDLVYKKVPLGSQGSFPPASFGFGPPHITGSPIQAFVDLGQSPSPTGLAFMPSGPDTGKLVVAQYGATNDPDIGRDVLLVDAATGAVETLITGLQGPTDVVQDPFGRVLIADYDDDSVWLLVYGTAPDTTPPAAGAVTPFNTRFSQWVDSPFDLRTSFTDSDTPVTACEYTIDGGATWQSATVAGTMPTFTCEASGIVGTHGQVLRLSMRATSEGGTAQATVLQVTVDAAPPPGTVAINGGASFTRIPTVTLTLSATDASGLADMCISNAPSCSTWVPFARTRSWSLPAGDGVKSVYARFRDRVGNATTGVAQDQIVLDSTAPTNPTTLTSSSHGVETWSGDRTVQVHWAGATDGGTGVSGYSLRWDRVATTLPDVHADTTGVTATSPALADGRNHFVHLRTVDQAGNWTGGAVHLGPFFIDGTPPYTGTLAAAPGPARISLSWTGFSDPTSGLAVSDTYKLVFSTSAYPAARCTNGTPIFVGTATQFVHQNLASGTRYYYRICAFDKAGNVSTGAARTAIAQ